ncbi:co-chaperone GroES [soil metagenome]
MLQPVGDRILVKPLDNQEVTKGGIVLPDSAKEKPQTGKVVALGQGKFHGEKLVTFQEMGIEMGSVIMFSKYGPTEIKIGNEDYFVIESHDVLGVISK